MGVINNTPDPAFWRPIEDHCIALGERFKFVNQDNVDGYKAGALRLALAHTAPDAEIIGVPTIVVVGRNLAGGPVADLDGALGEVRDRATGEREDVAAEAVVDHVVRVVKA